MAKARGVAHLKKHYHKPGTAPGTLISPPPTADGNCHIKVIKYSSDSFSEQGMASITDCCPPMVTDQVTWINIEGDYNPEMLQQLAEYYTLHPFSLEDTLHRGHRPKLEDYHDYLFIILYLLEKNEEQVSMFLTGKVFITLENHEHQSFEILRQRLRNPQPGDDMRQQSADYLAYEVCDMLVDQFFPRLESYGEKLDSLEEQLFKDPNRALLDEIHQLKMELLVLLRLAWAERDVIASLERQRPQLAVYLRDIYDHMLQVIEILETYREMTTSILDGYLSSVSNQMNTVMKTLTIIATIFIPLTFIVGVYGMNFNPATSPFNMPEITARYGYPAVWTVMLSIAGGMLLWFRRKKWL